MGLSNREIIEATIQTALDEDVEGLISKVERVAAYYLENLYRLRDLQVTYPDMTDVEQSAAKQELRQLYSLTGIIHSL